MFSSHRYNLKELEQKRDVEVAPKDESKDTVDMRFRYVFNYLGGLKK